MADLLQHLESDLSSRREKARRGARSRQYHCRCGRKIAFDDPECPACGAILGYLPGERRLASLQPGSQPDTWVPDGSDEPRRFCELHDSALVCNWLLKLDNPRRRCASCRLTRTLPDLSDPDNVRYVKRIERAKRRLVSQLIELGLPVRSKVDEDPDHGVMFDFLRSPPGGPQVMTGHASGLITLNVEEADDSKREAIRFAMQEHYRTLLGHFRHEIGHYYWDQLIWDHKWLGPFRDLFGDERASYAEALKRNYEQGPPTDWAQSYISAYATMHPWEDWAETWAHYMHITDTVFTALAFDLDAGDVEGEVERLGPEVLYDPDDSDATLFLDVVNGWREVTVVLNELARSMGEPAFYPFKLNQPAIAKLQFVQMVVSDARRSAAPSASG